MKFKTSLELLIYFKKKIESISINYIKDNDELIIEFEKLLEFDPEGHFKKLYNIACEEDDSTYAKFKYLNGCFHHIAFKNIDFDFDIDFFLELEFNYCKFENITISEELKYFYYYDVVSIFERGNEHKNIQFVNNELRYTDIEDSRLGYSSYTCHVNLYIELDRICNARCSFCRNNYYDKKQYNFKKILSSTKTIKKHIKTIVIGGGEPTLRHKDLIRLSRIDGNKIISSNLSADIKTIKKLKKLGYDFLVSRHAIDKSENAAIFHFSQQEIENTEKNLKYLSTFQNSTLSTVCFKDGINSFEKLLNYINWGIEGGYTKFLIQTLHQDNSFGKNEFDLNDQRINTQFIHDIIKYLQTKRFTKKPTIYSTAGYKSTVLTDYSITIAFKEYVSEKELKEQLPQAVKRTIDLSIDPNGTIYENWHQNSDIIELPKTKILGFIRR